MLSVVVLADISGGTWDIARNFCIFLTKERALLTYAAISFLSSERLRTGWCCNSISMYANAMMVRFASMLPLHSSITWVAKAIYAVSILQSPASFIRRKKSVSANKK